MTAKKNAKLIKFKKLSPLYAVAGCGGGASSLPPSITQDAGAVEVLGTSASLQWLDEKGLATYFEPVFSSDLETIVTLPDTANDEQSVVIDGGLKALIVGPGEAVYAHTGDWADIVADQSQPVVVSGDLWLVHPISAPESLLTLNLQVSNGTLGFDLQAENQMLVLSSASILAFGGNDLRVSDGTVDITAATVSGLADIYVGSSVIFTAAQFDNIGGRVLPSSENAQVVIVIADMAELNSLVEMITGKITDPTLAIGLEAKSTELIDAISHFIREEASNPAFGGATVTLTDGQNDAPVAIEAVAASIAEDAAPGTLAINFNVIDPDAFDTHLVSVSDDRFEVVEDSVYVRQGAAFDFETEGTITLTLTATDTGGMSVSDDILIHIEDVNEAPTAIDITSRLDGVIEATYTPRTLVGTVRIQDDALGDVVLELYGENADYFEIRGQSLYLRPGLLPRHADTDALTVTVTATDPELVGQAPVETSFDLELLRANTLLRSASEDSLLLDDIDNSSSVSVGDTITVKFNQAIDANSLTISDFTGTGVTWGESSLSTVGEASSSDTFIINIGIGADLSDASSISISRGFVEDTTGAVNGNIITFELPQFGDPEPEPPAPPSENSFDIELIYSGVVEFRDVFLAGVAFWEGVIIGDLSDVGLVDDLQILASVEYIDGLGGTLGYAGWTDKRPSNEKLPYRGEMTFDADDFAVMAFDEQLDVVLHEIGHVLGFGTLWGQFNLVSGSRYLGDNAVREYQAAGGTTDYIPLETDGGPGTAYAHWDEIRLDDEIMTGYLNYGENIFSRITIGAIEDLGYTVDYASAEPYSLDANTIFT